MAPYEPGSVLLPDTESACVLEFTASRMGRNKFLLFTSHPVYSILSQQLKRAKAHTTEDLKSRLCDRMTEGSNAILKTENKAQIYTLTSETS